jgi:hypothetical protein
VELAVMPVLLGGGIPLLPPGVETKLVLTDYRILPKSGIAVLAYQVEGGSGAAPRIHFVKRPRVTKRVRAASGARKDKKPAGTGRARTRRTRS